MRKHYTETVGRATAVLVAATMLASGAVIDSPAVWADEQNQDQSSSETRQSVRSKLEQSVKDAAAKRDIQTSSSGNAYTADTYGTFDTRLTDAQNMLADQDAADSQLQKTLDALDAAVKALKVASWSVNGVELTGDQNLTATIDGLSTKPDSLTAIGSDGSKVGLSIGGSDERHPALGMTIGAVSATAPQDGTRPAISVQLTWSSGAETTVYGRSFHLDTDGTWVMAHDLTLDANNHLSETNVTVAGQTVDIEWDSSTASNGIVSMNGKAIGSVDGQNWRIDYTATRTVDHAGLDQVIAGGKAMLLDSMHEYTGASRRTLDDAIGGAEALGDVATADQYAQASAAIVEAEQGLVSVTWSADINGTTMGLTRHDDGSWTLDTGQLDQVLAVEGGHKLAIHKLTIVSNDGGKATLTRVGPAGQTVYADRTLGVTEASGTARWEGSTADGNRPLSVSAAFDYTTGSAIDVKGGSGESLEFTARNGYLAANTTSRLDTHNNAKLQTVEVAGVKTRIVWSDTLSTNGTDTATTITRKGRAEGDVMVDGHTQHWVVYVAASRTEGRVASLSVIDSTADGSITEHQIKDFDESKTDYTLTLDSSHVSDRFTLGYASASSDDTVTQGDALAPSLGENAARILKVNLNGKTYTVTVRFAKPQPVATNTAARLSGIYVNRSGKAVKGDLIEGWDPDVLTYTLTLGADDPGVYVLPEAPDGVTVKASDVKQTAYATEQAWTSTAANGETRTYVVRVVRDHASNPTADERFTPSAPKDMDGSSPAPSQSETAVRAVGYLLDGKFVTMTADRFSIPEGGVFAYKSYAGQTVQVSTKKTGGMTYEYTLNVLAADGVTFASHTVTATYITEATHKALLDGILIDNKTLGGFDPAKTEYAAQIPNLDHWTVGASFDKDSGMSVTIHKEHARATLTATSADGLVSRTYVVNLTQTARQAGDAVDGVKALSETGSSVMPILCSMIGVLLAGAGGLFLRGLLRRRRDE